MAVEYQGRPAGPGFPERAELRDPEGREYRGRVGEEVEPIPGPEEEEEGRRLMRRMGPGKALVH